MWTTDGIPICLASGNQHSPHIVSDGAGGAIIAWDDERHGSTNSDIYAKRIGADGSVVWGLTNGAAICTATGNQRKSNTSSDGGGAAIIAWQDERHGSTNSDIYAQSVVVVTGVKSTPVLPLILGQNYPNPFGKSSVIRYSLQTSALISLEIYDVTGRKITHLVNEEQHEGLHVVKWDGTDARGGPVSTGVYFYRLTVGEQSFARRMVLLR